MRELDSPGVEHLSGATNNESAVFASISARVRIEATMPPQAAVAEGGDGPPQVQGAAPSMMSTILRSASPLRTDYCYDLIRNTHKT